VIGRHRRPCALGSPPNRELLQRSMTGYAADRLLMERSKVNGEAVVASFIGATDRELLAIWALGFAASQAGGLLVSPFRTRSSEDHAWRQGWLDSTGFKNRRAIDGQHPQQSYA
jgi:hypothetical protein